MTDDERRRVARLASTGRLFGWSLATPEPRRLHFAHERAAWLVWPLPTSAGEEDVLVAILRQPVPLPSREAEVERARLKRRTERRIAARGSVLLDRFG